MTERIEISIDVSVIANVAINVEPGTILTREMLEQAIGRINAAFEDGAGDTLANGASLYLAINGTDENTFASLRGYDRNTGDYFTPEFGKPAGDGPAAIPPRSRVGHIT